MAGAQHGMCELTQHGVTEEWHGNGMGAAWLMCITLYYLVAVALQGWPADWIILKNHVALFKSCQLRLDSIILMCSITLCVITIVNQTITSQKQLL
jgi:hypothetical protein